MLSPDLEEALQAITSMIHKTESTKRKFGEGTSQHSLQKNRLMALEIAHGLVSSAVAGEVFVGCTKEELEKAAAPIASLLSKSEKAQAKLAPGSWQHTMLGSNLKALQIASALLAKALSEADDDKS